MEKRRIWSHSTDTKVNSQYNMGVSYGEIMWLFQNKADPKYYNSFMRDTLEKQE